VVERESAIIGDARERRETIHDDHVGMVKFSSRDDPGYKKVLNAIEMVLEESQKDNPSTNQSTYNFSHNLYKAGSITILYYLILEEKSEAVERQKVGFFYSISHFSLISIFLGHIQAPTFYDIPQIRASHFVTRNTLLSRIEKLFERSTTSLSRTIVILIGMGGVGKTQLTIEYCLNMKNSGKFRAIFWLDASSRNSLFRSMEIIAKWLLPGRAFDNPVDVVA
jgi:hypothetical protein